MSHYPVEILQKERNRLEAILREVNPSSGMSVTLVLADIEALDHAIELLRNAAREEE